jgi:lysophospholipase L1-like esterase
MKSEPTESSALLQITRRRPLQRIWERAAAGRLTIGFLGGSITDGANGLNWPEPVARWLCEKFPRTQIQVENAAIGATGSDSACLRAGAEIIAPGCDLTFVEYAVNDSGHPTPRRNRSREGLIRKLLAAAQEVVLVYTFAEDMRADMEAGRVPPSIAEFERLAEHYGLNSVWAGLHALLQVEAGAMTVEEWLPDGLHPSRAGSELYGRAVSDFLQSDYEQWTPDTTPQTTPLPPALDDMNWQSASLLPLQVLEASGPWILRRVHTAYHVQQVLESHQDGSSLACEFEGRGLILICDFGHASADFVYRLDGGGWQRAERERPGWCGDRGLVRAFLVADDLPLKKHRFELKVAAHPGDAGPKTEFRLAHVGILR